MLQQVQFWVLLVYSRVNKWSSLSRALIYPFSKCLEFSNSEVGDSFEIIRVCRGKRNLAQSCVLYVEVTPNKQVTCMWTTWNSQTQKQETTLKLWGFVWGRETSWHKVVFYMKYALWIILFIFMWTLYSPVTRRMFSVDLLLGGVRSNSNNYIVSAEAMTMTYGLKYEPVLDTSTGSLVSRGCWVLFYWVQKLCTCMFRWPSC